MMLGEEGGQEADVLLLGPAWIHLVSLLSSVSPGLSLELGFAWPCCWVSHGLTWSCVGSLAWWHLDSLGCTYLVSLGITGSRRACIALSSLQNISSSQSMEQRSLPARNEGRPPKWKGKREKHLCEVFQMQSHLTTRARDHGTKQTDFFQVGLVPPTSDFGGPPYY